MNLKAPLDICRCLFKGLSMGNSHDIFNLFLWWDSGGVCICVCVRTCTCVHVHRDRRTCTICWCKIAKEVNRVFCSDHCLFLFTHLGPGSCHGYHGNESSAIQPEDGWGFWFPAELTGAPSALIRNRAVGHQSRNRKDSCWEHNSAVNCQGSHLRAVSLRR